jgi:hypothetical protein
MPFMLSYPINVLYAGNISTFSFILIKDKS